MAATDEVQAKNQIKRGATRHCCYGTCKSDSRYRGRDYMQGVMWISFPKPQKYRGKCIQWTHACGRKHFTYENVNKWTYICSKHFIHPDGPTKENPDPVPATFTLEQLNKMSRKRKPPTPRANPISKRQLLEASEALLALQDYTSPDLNIEAFEPVPNQDTATVAVTTSDAAVNTEKRTVTKCTQTMFVCGESLVSKAITLWNKII